MSPVRTGEASPVEVDTRQAAAARSACYAIFSQLVSSPHQADRPEETLPPSDLSHLARELGATLPYRLDLFPLVEAAAALTLSDSDSWRRRYSSLFEVGSEGPPVPLREDLARPQPRGKEEVVRFYDFFGYRLKEERSWQPDHLSVLLEFVHFLAFKESQAAERDRLSYKLAQRDFVERHLLSWIAHLRERVEESTRDPYLRSLFAVLDRFLTVDGAWLSACPLPEED